MVSLITALEIATNLDDVVISTFGPDKDGKYGGTISRGERHRGKLLISTVPYHTSEQKVKDDLQAVIDACVKASQKVIDGPSNPVSDIVKERVAPGSTNNPEAKIVNQVITAAKRKN